MYLLREWLYLFFQYGKERYVIKFFVFLPCRFDPNFKRGGFSQFGRGRGRFQRGRGFFRGRGGPMFEGAYPPDEFAMRRK